MNTVSLHLHRKTCTGQASSLTLDLCAEGIEMAKYEELMLNTVSALTNLSFYNVPDGVIWSNRAPIAEGVGVFLRYKSCHEETKTFCVAEALLSGLAVCSCADSDRGHGSHTWPELCVC